MPIFSRMKRSSLQEVETLNPHNGTSLSTDRGNILSDHVVGHGSATSSILNMDLENKIVITQSRLDGGKQYQEYLNKAYLLLEKYFDTIPSP